MNTYGASHAGYIKRGRQWVAHVYLCPRLLTPAEVAECEAQGWVVRTVHHRYAPELQRSAIHIRTKAEEARIKKGESHASN